MTRLLVGIFAGIFVSLGSYLLGTLALGVSDGPLIVTAVGSTILGIMAGVALLYLLERLSVKQQDNTPHHSSGEDHRSRFVRDSEPDIPWVSSNRRDIGNLTQSHN